MAKFNFIYKLYKYIYTLIFYNIIVYIKLQIYIKVDF